ncbi:phosphoethanolamine--lipid A transferase [Vibrio aestuarianus]|uniref:Phosphoethanolamine--lipid A transferase n=1 Tax=Vibrio aestuarianus TaxID=28171 RepID=A0A9X4FJ62_9VIBR|nr:phosphoethanolamine--lipid A transferase [Vibrio aestuarianus]MDE1311181.1 phosphoethanolamine--lipid A transferase [Vibrio aestuarianus]MDE1335737.1 phosphoethanolamine--lipid A transferase [Vibrio aestuarianus]MDE1358074.1 phosphoethanolamine--lipid A transferase [Vibrio aestuarianus]NGZ17866.1 phosphoethanolamine--lipid A transferase [Vibrio aestuarianus]NGZ93133.1 phosphoethanolamine--lipid A transferase [Vibrio aestuarianus subsp. cardii]
MHRSFKEINLSYVGISFCLALYFVVIVNLPVYSALSDVLSKLDGVKIGFVISIPIFFLATFNFLFNLFSWPWLTKPFFALLILLSAAVSYAGFNYGTLFDSDMIANIVETDSSEANSYFSLYSLVWMIGMGIIPALLLIITPIQKNKSFFNLILRKLTSMAISLVVIGTVVMMYYQDYASVGRNNSYLRQLIIPTQLVYSIGKYVHRTYLATPIIYREIGLDAKQMPQALSAATDKPTLVVFVLGETARSQNYQLNGYNRPTNSYTKALDVISFQDVSSCGTATAVSVPCMFSSFTRDNYSRQAADNQDNFLDILKRAQVGLFWIENDGGDKNVAQNIDKIEIDRSRVDEQCNGQTCYDMAMLENFEKNIDKMQGNRMLLMHLIGSHGPTYFQRYPQNKKVFQPDCPRADIENCTVEQIINTYDNTILYTDYVIAQTIEKLKTLEDKYNTALIYISDHGESLGENGLFLHGMPYGLAPEYQTQVPMIFWTSPGFEREKSLNTTCLRNNAQQKTYSQDNLFHSMLGIMDITTEVYNPHMDLFANCRS